MCRVFDAACRSVILGIQSPAASVRKAEGSPCVRRRDHGSVEIVCSKTSLVSEECSYAVVPLAGS